MATKTLTITEEAYDRLCSLKHEDESFSDVVMRITRGETDPMEHAGSMPGLAEAVDLEAARERFDRDATERHDDLFGQ